MRKCLVFVFAFLLLQNISAQKVDKGLQRQVEEAIKGFNGDIGVYIKNLENGKIVAVNADTVFPTASMVKVPILVGVMHKVERGELTLDSNLVYRDSLLYAGVDILGSLKQDEKIALGKVAMLMLTMSDNTASLWLQTLAGTGTRINEIMDSLGLKVTRVNSRTPGRENIRSIYGWGQTSPREMATLFERIANGEVINKQRSDAMLRMLSRNYWDKHAISQIPADV
ncbi:MAG: serine hydrolase, partial [Chitinophagaceae bacterium]